MAELTNGLAFLGLEMTDQQIHIFHAACDFDGDGSISPHEFRSGLTKLNIHIDYRQLNDVINHFDRNGTGQIQYREFAREFGSGAGTSTGNGGGVGVQSSQESLRLASAVVDEAKLAH